MRSNGIVIAIDGPSGAGKSTTGRKLAERLAYTYIDTGAMYRAMALKSLRAGVDPSDDAALAALATETRIELTDGGTRVRLDGVDVSSDIRTREISLLASRISAHPAIRRDMVARQRELGRAGGVVLDGRDIGTVVFPDAEVKIFIDAAPRARAERRHQELQAAGRASDVDQVEREIRARDQADSTRADSPLRRADDAYSLDTTALSIEQVQDACLAIIQARLRA
ncbi:MAG: (d)CMP kinase [Vicinamibacteria bacterium]|jgi:cytidylate kinase|nr:(d)CMP kinase [Vicinamibacteria bacterium]